MPKLMRPALSGLAAISAMIALPVMAAQEDEQLWLQTNVHVPLDSNTRVTLSTLR